MDCDPGIDDALALAFGCGHPGLDLRGVTTVAGNVNLATTTANALSVLEFIGRPDVPVAAGSATPLLRSAVDARTVHGELGLGEARLPAAQGQPVQAPAADFLTAQAAAAPGEITLIAIGPLTNVALAVRCHPELVSQVAEIIIMGGSAGRGNVTPAAEFNIAHDPEAAAIVFGAGWRVTMIGLDVTLQACATPEVRERMRALGRLGSGLLLPALGGYRSEATGGQPVHDVCALACAVAPELFECRPARVDVEVVGRWTSGMTVTDFRAAPADRNALVAMNLDVAGFWDLVLGAYARLPVASATK